jgi:twitching motility protein PilT
MARIDSFLRLVAEQSASDLHFHAGMPPIIRYHGELLQFPFRRLTELDAERFLLEMMTDEQRVSFEHNREADFAYEVEGCGRFRANVFVQTRGMGAVFRYIPAKLPSIDELRLPEVIRRFANNQNGLVLVTGPTGSGKTTTLAAIVHEINREDARHIITIEDPIEFVHPPQRSVITQRQVGLHAESFAAALRSALREAPDVLVVGELRDRETVALALAAAETGVLVFGTLHTNSAAKAVDRILGVMMEDEQARSVLASVLRGVVAQHLCRRASGDGLVAVHEILMPSHALAHMIRDNKLHQIEGYLQSNEHLALGGQSLDGTILDCLREGIIALEEGEKIANDRERLRELAVRELGTEIE